MGDSYAFLVSPNGSVFVLDLAQKKVIATFPTAGSALALGPDNSSLIVANTAGVLII